MSVKVEVSFSNGEIYHIDADVIATARTEYYMQVDGVTDRESKEWKEEYAESITTPELLDWIQNNMNWSDVKEHAVLQPKKQEQFNYHQEFLSANFQTLTQ